MKTIRIDESEKNFIFESLKLGNVTGETCILIYAILRGSTMVEVHSVRNERVSASGYSGSNKPDWYIATSLCERKNPVGNFGLKLASKYVESLDEIRKFYPEGFRYEVYSGDPYSQYLETQVTAELKNLANEDVWVVHTSIKESYARISCILDLILSGKIQPPLADRNVS